MHAGFLHHFPLHGLLQRLPDFSKTGHQRVMGISVPIPGNQQRVTFDHPDDHRRVDSRVNHMPAFPALQETLLNGAAARGKSGRLYTREELENQIRK